MEIVSSGWQIDIQGSMHDPLFPANQIARILGLSNSRSATASIPEHLKVQHLVQSAGGNQITTLLREQAVYGMVFRSRSENADKIQEWVCHMIANFRKQAFDEQHEQLAKSQSQILSLQQDVSDKLEARASYLYAIKPDPKEPDSDCQVKIGMTKDCSKRQGPYKQIAPNALLLISVEVDNGVVRAAETLLKQLLSKCTVRISAEVFRGTADVIKMWTVLVADIFEAAHSKNTQCLTAWHCAGNEHLRDKSDEQLAPTEMRRLRELLERFHQQEKLLTTEGAVVQPTAPTTDVSDAARLDKGLDFDKFVEECCKVHTDSRVTSASIYGRYRTWARHLSQSHQSQLTKYLQERFRAAKFGQGGHVRHGFIGVDIIEFSRPVSIVPSQAERFCSDCCSDSSASRLFYHDLQEAFHEWLRDVDGEAEICDRSLQAVHAYLNQFFVPAACWMPETKTTVSGYYGICLKGDEDKYLRRMNNTTARPVNLVDPATQQIKRKFDSVAAAAEYVGISTAGVSRSVRQRKLRDGYIMEYATEQES